ncbi:PAP10 [Scenedesmus sp. PABB004]|nr:PAP10 [Scenedesmus sp. PABB004]
MAAACSAAGRSAGVASSSGRPAALARPSSCRAGGRGAAAPPAPQPHAARARRCRCGAAAAPAAPAAPPDAAAAKSALLAWVAGTARGARAGKALRGQIEEAQVAVEACAVGDLDYELLAGTWRLAYTTAADVVPIVGLGEAPHLPGGLPAPLRVGGVFQRFSPPGEGRVENVIQFTLPGTEENGLTFTVGASYTVCSGRRIALTFEEAQLGRVRISPALEALLAPALLPRGWLQQQLLLALREFKVVFPFRNAQQVAEGRGVAAPYLLTYLDDSMLIGRATAGAGAAGTFAPPVMGVALAICLLVVVPLGRAAAARPLGRAALHEPARQRLGASPELVPADAASEEHTTRHLQQQERGGRGGGERAADGTELGGAALRRRLLDGGVKHGSRTITRNVNRNDGGVTGGRHAPGDGEGGRAVGRGGTGSSVRGAASARLRATARLAASAPSYSSSSGRDATDGAGELLGEGP